MNTLINYKSFKLISITVVLALSVANVLGDDLNPPPYRGNPLSVLAEWQLIPGTTTLNLTQSNWVDDNDPSTTLHPLPFSNPVQPMNPGHYQFQLPNWIDNLPIKYMRVQLTWLNNLNPPVSLTSQALDGVNSLSGQIVYTSPLQVDAAGIKAYQFFDLIFQPNPDFERIDIVHNSDSVLSQVVVDTISTVPEPATLVILGLGALSVIRHRRRTVV